MLQAAQVPFEFGLRPLQLAKKELQALFQSESDFYCFGPLEHPSFSAALPPLLAPIPRAFKQLSPSS